MKVEVKTLLSRPCGYMCTMSIVEVLYRPADRTTTVTFLVNYTGLGGLSLRAEDLNALPNVRSSMVANGMALFQYVVTENIRDNLGLLKATRTRVRRLIDKTATEDYEAEMDDMHPIVSLTTCPKCHETVSRCICG